MKELMDFLTWIDWKMVPDGVLEKAADEYMRRFGDIVVKDQQAVDELERWHNL